MTIGVGGSTAEAELAALADMTGDVAPITLDEIKARLARAQDLMRAIGIDLLYIHAGTNLLYFTGVDWHPSERLVCALLPAEGELCYVLPAFEASTFRDRMLIEGDLHCWEEHESPYALFGRILGDFGGGAGRVGIDEAAPFFISDGLRQAAPSIAFKSATPVTAGCRAAKSASELAILQKAKNMTLEVHKAAARILRPGISTAEVTDFIDKAHRAVGEGAGSFFCIVLFGEATAYPHGVKDPQILKDGDMVLIDTGCELEGYHSDITRSYVFGQPSDRQRQVWDHEHEAQAAAFAAAQIGAPCGRVDEAARAVLEGYGYGPDYAVPGLPHRTGHGIGLDIHEWPYLVRSDRTPLEPGMCFSNEPMICIYGEFGVRLEDHFYMTEDGPRWFTEPSPSIDDPFGYEV
jgi:Xaa-Pro dipeptidase